MKGTRGPATDIMKTFILFSFSPNPVRELQDPRDCLSLSLVTLSLLPGWSPLE